MIHNSIIRGLILFSPRDHLSGRLPLYQIQIVKEIVQLVKGRKLC